MSTPCPECGWPVTFLVKKLDIEPGSGEPPKELRKCFSCPHTWVQQIDTDKQWETNNEKERQRER